jgi:hypothetical protein
MIKNQPMISVMLILLIGALIFSFPSTVWAQEVDPPAENDEIEDYDGDKLVFEPQFFWELPFGQGFQISFSFGIAFQVPTELMLMDENAFNFFLRFRSYIIPAEGEAEITP